MTIPDRITARWIATLSNEELQSVEAKLHGSFDAQDATERTKQGSEYSLMKAPETLTNAWIRWSMVCNATRERGLRTSYRR